MRRLTRAALAMAGAMVLGVGLSGCADAPEKTISYATSSVTVTVGETLVVDLGEINSSIGTNWVITTEPDPSVLSAGESVSKGLGDAPGSPSELAYRFTAMGEGTTIIELEYRFRGSVPETPAERMSGRIEVTVK